MGPSFTSLTLGAIVPTQPARSSWAHRYKSGLTPIFGLRGS